MPSGEIPNIGPLTVLSVLLCLAAILWCVILVPRLRSTPDRFLVGLIGLLCVYHSVKELRSSGIWIGPSNPELDQISGVVITALYLLAVVILEFYTAEHRSFQYRLRLAEANEAPPVAPTPPVTTVLRRHQEVCIAVADSSPLPTFAVDQSGAVCFWNNAAERLFGFEKSEVVGSPLPILVSSSGPLQGLCMLRAKDGKRLDAELHTAPLNLGGDSAPGRLTIVSVPVTVA